MCSGVPYKAWCTELALGPGGVVDAAETVASVGVTELGRVLRVCIPTAVTWNTKPRCFVEASTTLVTVWAAVPGKALVTLRGAIGICTEIDKDTHQSLTNANYRASRRGRTSRPWKDLQEQHHELQLFLLLEY